MGTAPLPSKLSGGTKLLLRHVFLKKTDWHRSATASTRIKNRMRHRHCFLLKLPGVSLPPTRVYRC